MCCTKGSDFVCCGNRKEDDMKRLLRDQLEIYSYQFKQAATVFAKVQIAFLGSLFFCYFCALSKTCRAKVQIAFLGSSFFYCFHTLSKTCRAKSR